MADKVLLLKASDEKYTIAIEQCPGPDSSRRALKAHFKNVLTYEYINSEQLCEVLTHLEQYSGILVTSPRSAIAVTNLVNALEPMQKLHVLKKLRAKPIFSVGAATSRELLPLKVTCKGDNAGSASALSDYLHRCRALPADCRDKPMMFLCGDKRREILPESFRLRGLPLKELVVYQSCAVKNVTFPAECKVPNWIVFFSPSGIKVVKDMNLPWESIRKAAIGTVTAAALHEHALSTGKAFWNADVVAPKPNPDSLAGAIFSYEEKE
ncbi:hypothetical protein CCR75_008095 [Bremia lactucae]|uniref:Uroporphyrinogen-III synthase n=1 Tax=Bremia lactucae TaxID=4779 RepID=A0A976IDD7_BRELC|nr:hypothetical protein CCR75_008095 [Bremia lactucae]